MCLESFMSIGKVKVFLIMKVVFHFLGGHKHFNFCIVLCV